MIDLGTILLCLKGATPYLQGAASITTCTKFIMDICKDRMGSSCNNANMDEVLQKINCKFVELHDDILSRYINSGIMYLNYVAKSNNNDNIKGYIEHALEEFTHALSFLTPSDFYGEYVQLFRNQYKKIEEYKENRYRMPYMMNHMMNHFDRDYSYVNIHEKIKLCKGKLRQLDFISGCVSLCFYLQNELDNCYNYVDKALYYRKIVLADFIKKFDYIIEWDSFAINGKYNAHIIEYPLMGIYTTLYVDEIFKLRKNTLLILDEIVSCIPLNYLDKCNNYLEIKKILTNSIWQHQGLDAFKRAFKHN